jgi:hypothetical protein
VNNEDYKLFINVYLKRCGSQAGVYPRCSPHPAINHSSTKSAKRMFTKNFKKPPSPEEESYKKIAKGKTHSEIS